MTLPVLLDDALRVTAGGSEVRVSLPWIRSLPMASLRDLDLSIDGDVHPVADPSSRAEWWFIQDRIVLTGPAIDQGEHEITVSFTLEIPYLAAGPDGPLRLPFRETRTLTPVEPHQGASLDVAA